MLRVFCCIGKFASGSDHCKIMLIVVKRFVVVT